jgi:hypothetical protein
MQTQLDILRDVTQRFSTAGIKYMLTGSFALNYYAQPRMTRDIDLVVALEPGDVDSVVAMFEPDYYVPRNVAARAILRQSLFNLIHSESIVKVDCIVRKNTEYRLLEFDRRQEVAIGGAMIWIVSREDLIISKLLWAKDSRSELQLCDLANLLETDYDAAYLETWAKKLGVNDLLNECRK